MEKEFGFPTVPFLGISDTANLIGIHRTSVWRHIGKTVPEERDTTGRIIVRINSINILRKKYNLPPLSISDIDYYWEYGRLPHGVNTN